MREQSSGQSRGFGFVAFADAAGGNAVLERRDHLIDGRWYGTFHPLRHRCGRPAPRTRPGPSRSHTHAPPPPCVRVEAKAAVPRGPGQNRVGPGAARSPARPAAATDRNADSPPPRGEEGEEEPDCAQPQSLSGQHRKIFVGGLHGDTGDASLSAYFSVFGQVDGAQVLYNRNTGRSRGFGFVTFGDAEALAAALASRMHIIDGKLVRHAPCTLHPCTHIPLYLCTPAPLHPSHASARPTGGGQARRAQDDPGSHVPCSQRGGGSQSVPRTHLHPALGPPCGTALHPTGRLRQALPAARPRLLPLCTWR